MFKVPLNDETIFKCLSELKKLQKSNFSSAVNNSRSGSQTLNLSVSDAPLILTDNCPAGINFQFPEVIPHFISTTVLESSIDYDVTILQIENLPKKWNVNQF